jgi:hypothetical protein
MCEQMFLVASFQSVARIISSSLMILVTWVLGWLSGWAYFCVGVLLFCRSGPSQRVIATAPLAGCTLISLLGTVELMIGLKSGMISGGLLLLATMALPVVLLRDEKWRSAVAGYGLVYTLVFALHSTVAFPGAWLAGGDWYVHLAKALAISRGEFGPQNLDRSPFYAAGSVPLFLVLPPLQAFASHAAAVGAAASMTLLAPAARLMSCKVQQAGSSASGWRSILLLLVSPFFLISLQNMWPKLAMAGALVAMLACFYSHEEGPNAWDLLCGWIWLWAGIAFHTAHVFYVPLALILLWQHRRLLFRTASPVCWGGFFLVPLLFGIGYEAWSLCRFGLEAKINSNPLVTFGTELSFTGKIAQNAASILVGDQAPIRVIEMCKSNGSSWMGIGKTFYFTVAAFLPWLSGSVLGLLLTWLPAMSLLKSGDKRFIGGRVPRELLVGMGLALVAALLVLQGVSHWGALQAGLPGIVMVCYWLLGGWLQNQAVFTRTFWFSLGLGATIFVGFNAFVTVLVRAPVAMLEAPRAQLAATDGDLMAATGLGLNTFALSGFPWVTLIAIVAAVFLFKRLWRLKDSQGSMS